MILINSFFSTGTISTMMNSSHQKTFELWFPTCLSKGIYSSRRPKSRSSWLVALHRPAISDSVNEKASTRTKRVRTLPTRTEWAIRKTLSNSWRASSSTATRSITATWPSTVSNNLAHPSKAREWTTGNMSTSTKTFRRKCSIRWCQSCTKSFPAPRTFTGWGIIIGGRIPNTNKLSKRTHRQ